ncbi:MAG: LPS export ABC transporter permease LptF [Alphaproteobacteria bacterium]|nr:LPS export ABC transporter permease LptF [Alphaproteobacteria bacterium]
MSTIDRYLARQIVLAALFVTAGVTFAVWLTQSLRFIDYIVNRGLPLISFVAFVGLMLPTFLAVVFPIALFVGTLFVFQKLTAESEIVVMRAAGLSPLSVARPVIVVGIALVGVCYALTLYLMPTANRAFKDWQFKIRNNYSQVVLQEGVFNTLMKGVTVYVRDRSTNGELQGILIHDGRARDRHLTIMAERGALVQMERGPRILLVNGNRQEVSRSDGRLQLLYFDSYTADFQFEQDASDGRWRETSERYLPELFNPDEPLLSDKVRRSLQAEGHQRLAGPLYALAYPLVALAALLFGDFSRRGQSHRIVVAAGAVVVIQVGALAIQNASSKVPMLMPLIYVNALLPIAACLALLSIRRMRRPPESAPDRGEAVAAT